MAATPASAAPTVPVSAEVTTPATTTAVTSAAPALSGKKVVLETTMGNITIALDPAMPVTAGNFETLVNKGFYNGTIFHRVISGFMIQGGDPTGTGMGGPGYTIQDEATNETNSVGAVAMANTGMPNSGGSQFFINLKDNDVLNYPGQDGWGYCVFGKVTKGMETIDAMAAVETGRKGPHGDVPLEPIIIKSAKIAE